MPWQAGASGGAKSTSLARRKHRSGKTPATRVTPSPSTTFFGCPTAWHLLRTTSTIRSRMLLRCCSVPDNTMLHISPPTDHLPPHRERHGTTPVEPRISLPACLESLHHQLHAIFLSRSGCPPLQHVSMTPAPSSARLLYTPRRVISPGSGFSTSATVCGPVTGSSRRAGWTMRARRHLPVQQTNTVLIGGFAGIDGELSP